MSKDEQSSSALVSKRAESTARLTSGFAHARSSGFSAFIAQLLKSKRALIGGFLILLIAGTAILAPVISPHDPASQTLQNILEPPAWSGGSTDHLLGTDHLGRDMLSRIMHGGRISLLIGASAVIISGTIGVTLGLLGGFVGGRVDTFFMRLADIQLAFPKLFLVILILVLFGRSIAAIIIVMAISDWVIYARVVRGKVLGEKELEYVLAARSVGASTQRLLFRHLLPNMIPVVAVVATLQFGIMIMLESSLSYLGIGVQPPTPSWGRMLNDGQVYMSLAWWPATLPGLAIVLTVVGINFLGDAIRDVLGVD
jgi:peptide/nickel transport system permease protein